MRPMVPYPTAAMKRTAQTPVMMPPIGKIRIFRPGTTKGALDATTRVWIGDDTADAVVVVAALAKTPLTNVASLLEREVLTVWPLVSMPVNVTVGMRSFSRVAL